MKNKFIATGFHGTTIGSSVEILKKIDFTRNIGDKFLGQGFYLWRDSYNRAYNWKGGGCTKVGKKDKTVIGVDLVALKSETLNFTSFDWNNERQLIEIYLQLDSSLYFGEFIDFLIEKKVEINLVVIADLGTNPRVINMDKNIKFAYSDIQMCVKNDKFIDKVVRIKYDD